MKKMSKYIIYVTLVIALMITMLIIGGLWFGPKFEKSQPEWADEKSVGSVENEPITIGNKGQQPAEEEIVGSNLDLVTAVVQVAKSNIPAVVHIEITEGREVPNPFFPFSGSPFFRKFFGLPKHMPKKFERKLIGVGTGMIIDAQGHILTNNHVVAGASKIQVTLADGKKYPAKVIGTDPKTDLGVIQIPHDKPLSSVTFGDSDRVQVGQWVVAIGQSRNLSQSVTQGIISAKHRTGITDPSDYQDFLQTDAAINPGNSGGPLLTLRGQVIGINSAIMSQSGGFEGIGFAIPSNMAVHVVNALIKHGKVERGWLGVSIQDLTPDLAKSFGLETTKGALIADVTQGGPADTAGLKRGDVVLGYQKTDVADAAALRNRVANTPIGKEIKITVWRDKKEQEFSIKIGNLQDMFKMIKDSLKDLLGVEVRPVSVQEIDQYGLSAGGGVTIEWIDPKGVLGRAGFEVGDIILAINSQSIQDLEGLANIVNALPRHQEIVFLALDHRTGQVGYVKATID